VKARIASPVAASHSRAVLSSDPVSTRLRPATVKSRLAALASVSIFLTNQIAVVCHCRISPDRDDSSFRRVRTSEDRPGELLYRLREGRHRTHARHSHCRARWCRNKSLSRPSPPACREVPRIRHSLNRAHLSPAQTISAADLEVTADRRASGQSRYADKVPAAITHRGADWQ
jgi:hypothetical protein